MKKLKLMLVSLSILAVVGGALAFKAKNGQQICTTVAPSSGICPDACPSLRRTTDSGTPNFICTAPTISNGFDLCHITEEEAVPCNPPSVQLTLE